MKTEDPNFEVRTYHLALAWIMLKTTQLHDTEDFSFYLELQDRMAGQVPVDSKPA